MGAPVDGKNSNFVPEFEFLKLPNSKMWWYYLPQVKLLNCQFNTWSPAIKHSSLLIAWVSYIRKHIKGLKLWAPDDGKNSNFVPDFEFPKLPNSIKRGYFLPQVYISSKGFLTLRPIFCCNSFLQKGLKLESFKAFGTCRWYKF
jgi:hypothetical protein